MTMYATTTTTTTFTQRNWPLSSSTLVNGFTWSADDRPTVRPRERRSGPSLCRGLRWPEIGGGGGGAQWDQTSDWQAG